LTASLSALTALGGISADLLLEIGKVDELISLAPKLVSDH
jgi:hypothetical protein